MALWWERLYPLLGAAAAAAAARLVPALANALSSLSPDAVSAGINMAAIFIGFMATMAGVILATSSKAVTFMKRVGKLEQLVAYIWSSIWTSFVFLVISITVLVFTARPLAVVTAHQGWIWFAAGAWSLLATLRATHITMILVRNSAKEE